MKNANKNSENTSANEVLLNNESNETNEVSLLAIEDDENSENTSANEVLLNNESNETNEVSLLTNDDENEIENLVANIYTTYKKTLADVKFEKTQAIKSTTKNFTREQIVHEIEKENSIMKVKENTFASRMQKVLEKIEEIKKIKNNYKTVLKEQLSLVKKYEDVIKGERDYSVNKLNMLREKLQMCSK